MPPSALAHLSSIPVPAASAKEGFSFTPRDRIQPMNGTQPRREFLTQSVLAFIAAGGGARAEAARASQTANGTPTHGPRQTGADAAAVARHPDAERPGKTRGPRRARRPLDLCRQRRPRAGWRGRWRPSTSPVVSSHCTGNSSSNVPTASTHFDGFDVVDFSSSRPGGQFTKSGFHARPGDTRQRADGQRGAAIPARMPAEPTRSASRPCEPSSSRRSWRPPFTTGVCDDDGRLRRNRRRFRHGGRLRRVLHLGRRWTHRPECRTPRHPLLTVGLPLL